MAAADLLAPLVFGAVVWWFSTGAILWLNRLPRASFAWSFAAASALGGAALVGLATSAAHTQPGDAYVAFACAVIVWGWHEMSFLMGFIVGPRRAPCPRDAHGWRRFRLAAATLIHHEVAIALTAVAIVALTWGQPNQIGTLTFVLLWGMRLSAKFNLFLGAPFRSEDLMPTHLAHLTTYFRDRAMNPLFPVSISVGTGVAIAAGTQALAAGASPFTQTGFALVLAMTSLALLEHLFMFIPPPNQFLWGWAMPSKLQPNRVKLSD